MERWSFGTWNEQRVHRGDAEDAERIQEKRLYPQIAQMLAD